MPAPSLNLTLKNDLSELARIAGAIEAHGEAHGWPAKWVLNLNISLDELITNMVSYGYQDYDEHEIPRHAGGPERVAGDRPWRMTGLNSIRLPRRPSRIWIPVWRSGESGAWVCIS